MSNPSTSQRKVSFNAEHRKANMNVLKEFKMFSTLKQEENQEDQF